MANRYVRIYEGDGAHIVGFSASASNAPESTEFQLFMANRGYTIADVERPAGSTSAAHVEVRPPMSDDHLKEFGELCLQVIDPGSNETIVYDNRRSMPEAPYAAAPVLARG